MFKCFFGHRWFSFAGFRSNITFMNSTDEFTLKPSFCLNCHKVRWVIVDDKVINRLCQ